MTNELEIYIEDDFIGMFVKIWVYQDTPTGRIYVNVKGDLMTQTFVDRSCARPKTIKPFLQMERSLFDAMSNAMFKLREKEGKKTVSEYEMKGKLDATEKHLEDLRKYLNKLLKR